MKIAIVGATGLVGTEMLKVLEERNFPFTELIPVASEKSIGKVIYCKANSFVTCGLEEAMDKNPDLALFSAGGTCSLEWAPRFAQKGITVIDNSSAFRMYKEIPLVVPEVNMSVVKPEDKIIANPNCSTIQMVVALDPIHKAYGLKQIIVSTYQSITGTGQKAIKQYQQEISGEMVADPAYPHPIFQNCIPQCDIFLDNGYTKEEMKLVNETQKIMNLNQVGITATAVRVPVMGGHSESVHIRLEKAFEIEDIRNLLQRQKGIIVLDNPAAHQYPMPLQVAGTDQVYVGRIRKDESQENALHLWIVADNLRKGAATNAVQIAEFLLEKKWIGKS
jgi:aspartate-semialdehyde dehydrogenase